MPAICLCFHLHVPTFLKPYSIFDLGITEDYFDETRTIEYLEELADECLIPGSRFLKSLMDEHKGAFKIGLALSGSTLGLLQKNRPDVLALFQGLTENGFVELLAQNDGHTLSFMYDRAEFQQQLNVHSERLKHLFNREASVVMTTGGLYSNPMGYLMQKNGYKGIICGANMDGLRGRNVYKLYHPPHLPEVKLLFSDDEMTNAVEGDFSMNDLDASGMEDWITNVSGEVVNLVWDYRILGFLHKESSGIFNFLDKLISKIVLSANHEFLYPSEVFKKFNPEEMYDMSGFSTRNSERTSYISNPFQREALGKLNQMRKVLHEHDVPSITKVWQLLQDAFYFQEMGYGGRLAKKSEDAYSHFFNIIAAQELQLAEFSE